MQIAQKPENEALFDALMEFAGERGEINQQKLGKRLKNIQGRIEDGLRLEQFGKRQGTVLWRIRTIKPTSIEE